MEWIDDNLMQLRGGASVGLAEYVTAYLWPAVYVCVLSRQSIIKSHHTRDGQWMRMSVEEEKAAGGEPLFN